MVIPNDSSFAAAEWVIWDLISERFRTLDQTRYVLILHNELMRWSPNPFRIFRLQAEQILHPLRRRNGDAAQTPYGLDHS
jgi:hypothetical protein